MEEQRASKTVALKILKLVDRKVYNRYQLLCGSWSKADISTLLTVIL